jgi:hypothetical protein
LRKVYVLTFFPRSFFSGKNPAIELEVFLKEYLVHLEFFKEIFLFED